MSLRTIGYTAEGKAIREDEGPTTPGPSRDWFRTSFGAAREPEPADDWTKHPKPKALCAVTARCRHRPCVERRVAEAKRLHMTTNLTLGQIGRLLGGRDHSTVSYWIHKYQDKPA